MEKKNISVSRNQHQTEPSTLNDHLLYYLDIFSSIIFIVFFFNRIDFNNPKLSFILAVETSSRPMMMILHLLDFLLDF
jgi:hypothetical protein